MQYTENCFAGKSMFIACYAWCKMTNVCSMRMHGKGLVYVI